MMTRAYVPGTDPLAPMPLSSDCIADLIARTRESERRRDEAKARKLHADRRRKAAVLREQMILIGRAGAHYAHQAGCSFTKAAHVACSRMPVAWRTTRDAISTAWREMYPGERPGRRVGKRSK